MSVFSIAGSLLGGILGRNSERKAIDRMNAYNDPAAIRARYEAAGFNPLLGIGPGVDLQTTPGGSNFMGEALADVSLQLGEMASRPKAVMSIGKMNNIAAQNARLVDENRTLRLQPPAPSVYQRGGPSVKAGAASGGANATGPAGSPLVGNGSGVGAGPAVPTSAPSYDDDGKQVGIWVGGVFTPLPPGYSTGDEIETVLGDTFAAEIAVQPLAWRMAGDILHGQTMRIWRDRLNAGGFGRGLPPQGGDFGSVLQLHRAGSGRKMVRLPGMESPTDVGGMTSDHPALNRPLVYDGGSLLWGHTFVPGAAGKSASLGLSAAERKRARQPLGLGTGRFGVK